MTGVLAAILVGLGAAAWLWLLARVALVAARMYQIEEYEAGRLFAWGRQARVAAAPLPFSSPPSRPPRWPSPRWWTRRLRRCAPCSRARGSPARCPHKLAWEWLPPKKALVFTPRLRRLLATTAVLAVLVAAGVCVAVLLAPVWAAGVLVVVATAATTLLSMVLLVAANGVNRPAEARVRAGFLRAARRRIEQVDPLVIAVAGSYGKTSTKHILAHFLEQYGPTLATPKSFNTLMGVSRTVNDVLEDRHRTFIVEMDAYAPGEIASICALVRPRHALLTSVGPQHLERFGTVDRIADALYETLDALPGRRLRRRLRGRRSHRGAGQREPAPGGARSSATASPAMPSTSMLLPRMSRSREAGRGSPGAGRPPVCATR